MDFSTKLKDKYQEQIVPALTEEFGYQNRMEVPRLKKIVLSQGVGEATGDKKLVEQAVEQMSMIAGQKAIVTYSRKDISNFKLRKGMPIGAKVTLRGERMFEFLERLLWSALPRIRDFNGIKNNGFDGRGNYTLGITEQIIFPEMNIDRVPRITGMDITFVTSAETDKEALALLKNFGLPFKK
ncbi:50S ribosomal protein L5 [Croceimicrobium hydrocarbonivorans]|uniref:Large ribosomal subunit protein uL5 n=1 Tax=Croceimicrobium hydrocarbonivorans TaxID=2761580 RepID=A0A7H0VCA1_9FLAO|nr:50S ribosomal protein L5 [Croceimicrobium hydrocarbonivorans]QNR23349.1 50S ribosomal protein L5 [Croceimicrobium hydrocarbonivorans]|tara:strand:- start:1789 stop:2337 length:549 start_codon:yes stop_codon:yes gene_type:complete